jgi:hypothetical protein
MNNAICVCTMSSINNKLNDTWHKNFNLEKYNSFVITDITYNNDTKDGFLFNEKDLRDNLNFPHEVSRNHFWNSQGNRNITWFYAHLRMLNFYLSYPNYDYYWFFDDDIKIDNWDGFLTGTDADDSDFMSYFVFKKSNVETQPNIPHIDERTSSKQGWFNRFPGDKDTLPLETTDFFGSFFPTTRFSNRAMKKLLDLNNEGYYGYGEGFVPTVLNLHNMSLNTIITPENDSKMFDVDAVKIIHKNEKITWSWI